MQRCVALKIVVANRPCNITLKRCDMIFKEALLTIGFHENKALILQENYLQPTGQDTKHKIPMLVIHHVWAMTNSHF